MRYSSPEILDSPRIPRDKFYLQMARMMGLRATCLRAKGGTVITLDHRIVTTGYAGAPKGLPHCLDEGCIIGLDGGCTRTLHAEIAAISFAARYGISLNGGILYSTMSPCLNCAKAILNAGIIQVIYELEYRDYSGITLLRQGKIQVQSITFSAEDRKLFSDHSLNLAISLQKKGGD